MASTTTDSLELKLDKVLGLLVSGGQISKEELEKVQNKGIAAKLALFLERFNATGNTHLLKLPGTHMSTVFELAIKEQNIAALKLILDTAGAVSKLQIESALRDAAQQGHLALCKLLISRGNVDLKFQQGTMALIHAAENGHLAVVRLLIRSGADCHAANERALELAVENDRCAIVKLLLEQPGCDPANTIGGGVIGLLRRACRLSKPASRLKMLRLLLANDHFTADAINNALRQENSALGDTDDYSNDHNDDDSDSNSEGSSANNANNNNRNNTRSSARLLTEVVLNGYRSIVKILLEHGVDPNIEGKGLPVRRAVMEQADLAMIKLLVDYKADIRQNNDVLLVYAVGDDTKPSLVKYLLDRGLDPNNHRCQALKNAITCRDVDICKLLFSRGAKLRSSADWYISRCSERGSNVEMLKLILDQIKAEQLRWDISRPLLHAVKSGNTRMLMLLLEYSKPADITFKLLKLACSEGRLALLQQLLQKGQLNIRENDDELLLAAIDSKQPHIVKYLLEQGADSNAQNGAALDMACSVCPPKMVKLLLDNGADPNHSDSMALRTACRRGEFQIVKLLLANNANAQAADNDPIAQAARIGHVKIMQLLEEHGASVGSIGKEVFYYFLRRNKVEATKYLIRHPDFDPSIGDCGAVNVAYLLPRLQGSEAARNSLILLRTLLQDARMNVPLALVENVQNRRQLAGGEIGDDVKCMMFLLGYNYARNVQEKDAKIAYLFANNLVRLINQGRYATWCNHAFIRNASQSLIKIEWFRFIRRLKTVQQTFIRKYYEPGAGRGYRRACRSFQSSAQV